MYIHSHKCVYIYICAYIHTNTHTFTQHIYRHVYVHTRVCVCVCVCVLIPVSTNEECLPLVLSEKEKKTICFQLLPFMADCLCKSCS